MQADIFLYYKKLRS